VTGRPRFRDRAEAGRLLAERLAHLRDADVLVLALPRGGVPVAAPIAGALRARLDLLLVRKIGAPWQPELAIGAVVEGDPPRTVLNDEVIASLRVPPDFVREQVADQVAEIARQRRRWRGGRVAENPRGRTVVLVDDGIATGATARAALLAMQQAGAARRVLAAPVAPPGTAAMLRAASEEAVFLVEPEHFHSVGSFYGDFAQVEDGEVAAVLAAADAGRGVRG
jgi:putative phosphoribosyl transferase